MSEIYEKINKLYQNVGYMDKYGSDVWAAVILCVVFSLLTYYYCIINALQVVRSDWPNQRCNPLFIPFAGLINRPNDSTILEYTASNFNDCIMEALKFTVEIATQPLYFAVEIIQEAVNSAIDAINRLRELLSELRNALDGIIKHVLIGINNLVAAFMNFVIKMKDSFAKINGILTASLYTLFGSYMALQSMFLVIIDMIIIILIAIAVVCLLFFILSWIPFFGFYFKVTWGTIVMIMIAIMIPVGMFEYAMLRIMDMSTPPLPGIPGCFDEYTIVENGKTIKDINVNDILCDGSVVTAVIKFAADDQNIYNLYGVLVTGEHRVFHPILEWIKVKNHPASIHVPDFNKPFVYCLNTTKKTFMVGDTLYSDWDDIDEDVLADLHKNCAALGYLPEGFTCADIHTYLDSGFHPDTMVTLEGGLIVPIKEVQVNQVLASGDKVIGTVKIAAHDMKLYEFSFADNKIISSKNIHINDEHLGVINCMNKYIYMPCNKEPFLYHLLTDTKFCMVNNIRVNDYNSGIDKYLHQNI